MATAELLSATPLSAEAGSSAKYRLLAELGRGGMSDVFLALMSGAAGFSKLVVIKRLEPLLARDAEFLNMFVDEARLAARLNHPNVVQTHEVGFAQDRYFIAMEYLEGQPLNRILRKVFLSGGLDLRAQIRILCDALSGLHYAHELRDFDGTPLEVVHRDVSPQNVFVTYEGQIKVVDFGVARAGVRSSERRSGMIKGKVAYMAPEQALGKAIDRRADLFSLGVMLWEIAARRRMWKGLGVPEIIGELVAGRVPLLAAVAPEAPPALQAICERATAHEPTERFDSAAEFRAELELLLEELEPKSGRDIGAQVLGLFAEERARVQSLIERQLGHMRLGTDWMTAFVHDELPRIDDSDARLSGPSTLRPPADAGHGSEHHGSDASAYSVQMSSFRAEQLGTSSLLRRRAVAVSAVLALLALGGAFALATVLPAKQESTPPSHPAAQAAESETRDPVRASALAGALVAPGPGPDAVTEPIETQEPPLYRAPANTRREAEPSERRAASPSRRGRHFRAADERPLERAPGSRRPPRHLDKDDPWAE